MNFRAPIMTLPAPPVPPGAGAAAAEDGAGRASAGLDVDLGAAIAAEALARWPGGGRRKLAARAWGLTLSEARGAVEGRPSLSTFEKILRAEGWRAGAAIIGRALRRETTRMERAHDAQTKHLLAFSALNYRGSPVGDGLDPGRHRLGC
jgi:hypothetical protein